MLYPVIPGTSQGLRRRGDFRVFQQLLLFLTAEHLGVADKGDVCGIFAPGDKALTAEVAGNLLHQLAQAGADALGQQLVIQPEHSRLVVHRIAAEQLVSAFAGQHHLHIFACQLGNKEQGNTGGVCQGLVHVVLDFLDVPPEFLGGDNLEVVVYADFLGKALGPVDFIVFLAEVKAHGKGLLVGEIGGNIAGIYAAGQEAAHFHVADLVGVDGFLKDLFDLVHCLFLGHGLIGVEHGLPVPGGGDFAVLIPQIVGGHQAENALKEGLGRHGVLEGKVVVQGVHVELFLKARELENALDFRAIDKVAAHHGVVEGLDAEKVTGHKQAVVLFVPDGKAEHAPQPVQKTFLPLFKAVNQHFGVGLGAENVAFFHQLFSQFLIVVDFSVKGENQAAVFILDGLVAGGADVDNTQPPEAHGDAFSLKHAAAVGAAMGDDVRHILDDRAAIHNFTGKSANSAHIFRSFLKLLVMVILVLFFLLLIGFHDFIRQQGIHHGKAVFRLILNRFQHLFGLFIDIKPGAVIHRGLLSLPVKGEFNLFFIGGAEIGRHLGNAPFSLHHLGEGFFHQLHGGVIQPGLKKQDFLFQLGQSGNRPFGHIVQVFGNFQGKPGVSRCQADHQSQLPVVIEAGVGHLCHIAALGAFPVEESLVHDFRPQLRMVQPVDARPHLNFVDCPAVGTADLFADTG